MRRLLVALGVLALMFIAGLWGYRLGIGEGARIIGSLATDQMIGSAFLNLHRGVLLSDPLESESARKMGESMMRGALVSLAMAHKDPTARTSCRRDERRILERAADRVRTLSIGKDAEVREGLAFCGAATKT